MATEHKSTKTPRGGTSLNLRFVQQVINVSFLIVVIALFSSFLTDKTAPANVPEAVVGIDPYVGEIAIFPYNFAPQGWAECAGQILSIAQNTALFALIGTTYGGDGETTFALPDLRGRVPIGKGQGAGLPNYTLGQKSGSPTTSLVVQNLPAHNHTLQYPAQTGMGDDTSPTNGYPSVSTVDFYAETSNTTLGTATTNNTGSSVPANNMQPYLAMGYYIALVGIFPSQN